MKSNKSKILVIMLIMAMIIPGVYFSKPATGETVKSFTNVSAIEDGAQYAIVMNGITPTGLSSGYYYLKDQAVSGTQTLMDYAAFDSSGKTVEGVSLWSFEKDSDGYALKAASISDTSKAYLNISSGGASMGAKQKLSISFNSDTFTIINDGNRLRFTNSGGSNGSTPGFASGTKDASSSWRLYKLTEKDSSATEPPATPTPAPTGEPTQKPTNDRNEYESLYVEETDEIPAYTMAFISDIHIDYGLQNRESQLREDVINTTKKIREEENANVISVLGDVSSNNAGLGWTYEKYEKMIDDLENVLEGATKDGHVLMVTGNHDFVAGGSSFNSGDYSGIMNYANGELEKSEYLDQDDDSDSNVANKTKNNSNISMRLAYHYVIDGVDFIGINTPYSGGDNHSEYVLTDSTLEWVEDKLDEIGKDKPVIVLTHYPLSDSRNVKKHMAEPYNTRLKEILLQYENAILVYGHDHGNVYIEEDTYERVTPYSQDGSVLDDRPDENDSFVSSFAGSMGYYSNDYNPSLGDYEPYVVQALLVYMYSDRVTFQMKNYGTRTGVSVCPEPYTIYKNTGLTPNLKTIPSPEPTKNPVDNTGITKTEPTIAGPTAVPQQNSGVQQNPGASNASGNLKPGKNDTASSGKKPSSTKNTKVKGVKIKKSGNKITITWKKAAGASKYELLCSTSKNFKKLTKKVKINKTSCTIKKLKKGKTYYFRIRALSGTHKGPYSHTMKATL